MRLGLFSMTSGPCTYPDGAARVARAAEIAGFDSLWGGEHVVLPDHGAPFEHRGAVTDEYLAAMRVIWSEPRPAYQGRFVRFEGVQAHPQPTQRARSARDQRHPSAEPGRRGDEPRERRPTSGRSESIASS